MKLSKLTKISLVLTAIVIIMHAYTLATTGSIPVLNLTIISATIAMQMASIYLENRKK